MSVNSLGKWKYYIAKAFLVLSFLLAPISNAIAAEVYNVDILLSDEVPVGESQGFHQHNDELGILVSTVRGRYGIHRFDFATGSIEILSEISVGLASTISNVPGASITFRTIGDITFIDINGRLFSTNGQRGGTQFVRDFGSRLAGGSPGQSELSNIQDMGEVDGKLLLSTLDLDQSGNFTVDTRVLLLVSDGTRSGTVKVGPNFIDINSMFNIKSESFFIGRVNGEQNDIWQVSEGGSRLSQLSTPLQTLRNFSGFSADQDRLIVSGNAAYFCADNALAVFSNKNLVLNRNVDCSDDTTKFLKNSTGIYLDNSEEFSSELRLDLLNTDNLTTTPVVNIARTDEFTDLGRCTTSNALFFGLSESFDFNTPNGSRSYQLFTYSPNGGVKEVAAGETQRPGIECLNTKVVLNQRSVYEAATDLSVPIQGNTFDVSLIERQDRIFGFGSPSFFRGNNFVRSVHFIQLSKGERDITLAPILKLLLDDDSN